MGEWLSSEVRLNRVSSGTVLNGGSTNEVLRGKFHGGKHTHYYENQLMLGNIRGKVGRDSVHYVRENRDSTTGIKVLGILLILLCVGFILSILYFNSIKETTYKDMDVYEVPIDSEDLEVLSGYLNKSYILINSKGTSSVTLDAVSSEVDMDLLVGYKSYSLNGYLDPDKNVIYLESNYGNPDKSDIKAIRDSLLDVTEYVINTRGEQ